MKKFVLQIIALLLLAAMLCACGKGEGDTADLQSQPETQPSDPVQDGAVEHLISVKNHGGIGLADVEVRIYADDSMEDLIAMGYTGEDGSFCFQRVPGEGYVASINQLPTGYVAANYILNSEEMVIVPDIGDMTDEDMNTVQYRLGDAVLDFTLTGADGETYVLSELLQEKKAVVLNFWYLNCEPCKGEFPHFQEAYEKYSDDIALLALNPYDGDEATVAAFQTENGYTFPMMKADERWADMFGINSYPLTVVIDRYGNICLTHGGAIPDEETIENMFAYFCADDYSQQYFRSITLIPDQAV